MNADVKQGGGLSFALNDSSLVRTGRNFLLVGGRHIASNLVNIGSNDREFWMYTKVPEKTYLFCSHADFPQASRQLPVPFDPDWAHAGPRHDDLRPEPAVQGRD